jgi:hypothetical protein
MTHKYRGCIVVLSINKSVEPNEEQKMLTSSLDAHKRRRRAAGRRAGPWQGAGTAEEEGASVQTPVRCRGHR